MSNTRELSATFLESRENGQIDDIALMMSSHFFLDPAGD